jgi:hypothetical protein
VSAAADRDLTDLFRQGAAAEEGARCPFYATSDAAAAWHAGNHYNGAPGTALNAGEILLVTKGRGDRVNLFAGPSIGFNQIVATVTWDYDQEHQAAVRFERYAGVHRHRAEVERRSRADQAPAMNERDRQLIELRAKAPLQSKGRPVADPAHLPLFVSANEPSLF